MPSKWSIPVKHVFFTILTVLLVGVLLVWSYNCKLFSLPPWPLKCHSWEQHGWWHIRWLNPYMFPDWIHMFQMHFNTSLWSCLRGSCLVKYMNALLQPPFCRMGIFYIMIGAYYQLMVKNTALLFYLYFMPLILCTSLYDFLPDFRYSFIAETVSFFDTVRFLKYVGNNTLNSTLAVFENNRLDLFWRTYWSSKVIQLI